MPSKPGDDNCGALADESLDNEHNLHFSHLHIFIVSVKATIHTTCYNHFLKKDGCVFASASNNTRCKAPPKHNPTPVKQFALVSQNTKRSGHHHLERRYKTQEPVFPIGGGTGNCGLYTSTDEIGVCVWSGAEQSNPTAETAGWVNSLKTSNCGKRIYVHRTGKPETVQYAKVLDGQFFFHRLNAHVFLTGCPRVEMSNLISSPSQCQAALSTLRSWISDLFAKFNPSDKETADQLLYGGLTWDFDNLYGQSTAQGPI
ncbi:hypothetical protein PSHT_10263 [Puccinia striiformis]|uniref:Uncharacterized protein n=1 Tax=Puccinia striiformis TaxID=27350 RepID=A0A2S4VB48_9BASI|nr:hypothetical protein PSHT_10263 [Puccinia striiformis]